MSSDRPEETVDELIAQLKERVAERERSGEYPPGLEQELDAHFDRIAVHRMPAYDFSQLRNRIAALEHAGSFSPENIPMDTRLPGGSQLHRTVGKIVSRQTQGILAQMQRYSDALREALWEVVAALESPAAHTHVELSGELDAVFERLATYERAGSPTTAIAGLTQRVQELEAAQRAEFAPWFSNERFEQAFRGDPDALRQRYEDLALEFERCEGKVVDIGCGRGEFLELILGHGVNAMGIEIDSELVRSCVERGLPVEYGDGISWLRATPDGSLGGLSLIQVVEHLSAQELVDLVALTARKLKPGGKIVVETVNPQSLYVFAHSFFLDPTHVAPVHPAYLHFLFREAGFTSVDLQWRSPPPEDDTLRPVSGDDARSEEINGNVVRLNQLLFAAQDYALVAIR
jgi:2-polyprenyl-3-methyl-5-hydroxy-6-metoxy-1,4-benzoquinol methylase